MNKLDPFENECSLFSIKLYKNVWNIKHIPLLKQIFLLF